MEAREKILSTAVRLFAGLGYANTSLSQVAKEAEVSKALIFWHFDNKETLFRNAVQRTLQPYFINVREDLSGLSEVDQIKRLIDEYHAFVSKNVYSVKFFLGIILRDEQHPDDVVGHMNALQRMFLELLADVLERGRTAGVFQADITPALEARLILSALHGMLVRGFLGDESPERGTQVIERLKSRLVDALRRDHAIKKS